MLCRDDIDRVKDVNVCADELCTRVFAEFQQLGVNKTVGENFMFSGIFHDFETFLVHKSLNVPVNSHLSSKYFNNLSREHVTCEMMVNTKGQDRCRGNVLRFQTHGLLF